MKYMDGISMNPQPKSPQAKGNQGRNQASPNKCGIPVKNKERYQRPGA
jgi:hypothetical protein